MIFTKLLKKYPTCKYSTKRTVKLTDALCHCGNNYGSDKVCDYH